MEKIKKLGVWLLIFMLVMTQISLPGARVQVNAGETAVESVEKENISTQEEKETADEKKTKETTEKKEKEDSKKSDTTEESKKKEEVSEKKEEESVKTEESEKKEVSEKKEEESEKKEDESETDGSEEKDRNLKDSDKNSSDGKNTEKEESKEKDSKEETSVESASTSVVKATSKAITETSEMTGEEDEAGEEDEENIQEAETYTVKIAPVDKENHSISDATVYMQTSVNPGVESTWTEIKADDSGDYQLAVKDGESDCYYRFSITAENYQQFVGESFSFTQSNNPYFDISTVEDGTITIHVEMKKASKQYPVEIKAVDENDNAVSKPSITLETSTDRVTWTGKDKDSAGLYQLAEKEEDNVCYYRFSITADNYYKFSSDVFTFTEDNSYFDIDSLGTETITIRAEMKKKPEKYRVTIIALGDSGEVLEDANISMTWRKDNYYIYQQYPVEKGVYELDVRDKNESNPDIYNIYQFTIVAKDYTSYESSDFRFSSKWWNPYFDADTAEQEFTITVRMTSKDAALKNAKTKAKEELNQYKNLDNYREEQQEEIGSIIAEWSEMIENATTVNIVETYLKWAKEELDKVKTNIEFEDEEYGKRIFFKTSTGYIYRPDENGIITITNIDDGTFYITHPDGTLYTNDGADTKWRCVNEYQHPDDPSSIGFDVIVGTYGQFGAKYIGTYDATVTLRDLGRDIHFTVKVIDGGITELRASINGEIVSGKTIHVMGSERKTAKIEGRVGFTDQWISIAAHALKYTAGGSTSVNNASAEFRTWGSSGSITYCLDAKRSVQTTINIEATIVHPTSVRVECPSKATVGDWNGALNQYVGIMSGQGEGRYRVIVSPDNASNPGVTWKDLTPDVATFQTLHAAGIVPKKAGTAKFKVSCVDNPNVSTTVSILFQYEKPLKTAEAEKDVYYAKASDKTLDLTIITNGQKDSSKGASEQRFTWSYSTSGVVKVTDSVHYDKTSVTIPNWFSHTISILGEGTVTVTGTPWDSTENCKPVKFKVVVSSDVNKDKAAAERVEGLILAIGEVTLEKKDQIHYARSEFQALTSTQKGLVDDDIYAILVAAELELRRLERGDSDEDLGGDGNGGDNVNGDGDGTGTGTGIGGTGTADPSGGDGTGTGGELGTGNETSAAGAGLQDASDLALESMKKNNVTTVVQAATTNNNTVDSSGKKAGAKGKGRKFYEIDIQDIPKEVIEIVENISPQTKLAVTACILLAFVYGFMRRRRQHIHEEKEIS